MRPERRFRRPSNARARRSRLCGRCRATDSAVSLSVDGRRLLFAGDAVFYGGTIHLRNIPDCRLDAQISTLRKLRELAIDVLLPGHQTFSLTDGQRHIERANEWLDRLLIPPQMVSLFV